HCCYGPVTRSLPRGDFVDRLQSFSFHHLCYPNYGALTSTPAGLSPAEHASLHWTHNRTGRFPASGSRTRRHAFACNAICSIGVYSRYGLHTRPVTVYSDTHTRGFYRTGRFPASGSRTRLHASRATPSAASEQLLELIGFPISRSFT